MKKFIRFADSIFLIEEISKIVKEDIFCASGGRLSLYLKNNPNKCAIYRDFEYPHIRNNYIERVLADINNPNSEEEKLINEKIEKIEINLDLKFEKLKRDIKKILEPSFIEKLESINNLDIPEILFKKLADCGLMKRTVTSLNSEGLIFVGDIVCHNNLKRHNKDFNELILINNFGRKSFNDLIEILKTMGYTEYLPFPAYWEKRFLLTGSNFEPEYFKLKG